MRIQTCIVLLSLAALPASLPAQTAQTAARPRQMASILPRHEAYLIYREGPEVTPPKVLSAVEPEYTPLARKKKVHGSCLVTLTVDADGRPQNVQVARSIADGLPDKEKKAGLSLDDKAIEAVRQYRFQPAMSQGRPVPTKLNIEVHFQIF